MENQIRIDSAMAMLTQVASISHVFDEDAAELGCGPIHYALELDDQLYLVSKMMTPKKWWSCQWSAGSWAICWKRLTILFPCCRFDSWTANLLRRWQHERLRRSHCQPQRPIKRSAMTQQRYAKNPGG